MLNGMNLCRKVGEKSEDNLIASVFPPAAVTGVLIAGVAGGASYPRGTVMARSSADGKLAVLGAGGDGDAAYILSDPVEVGEDDTPAVAYRSGCFNTAALVLAEGYELTETDRDTLRKYGIILQDNMR